jgi:hypothetical protein
MRIAWRCCVLGLRADAYAYDVLSDNLANSSNANDARDTTQRIDPSTADAVDPVDPLVSSRGAELGLRASLLNGLRTTPALGAVELESKLLFEGDAGTTEPRRRLPPRRRHAGQLLARTPQLSAHLDLSFTRGCFVDVGDADRVPGALENVIAGGISWEPLENGLIASARLRLLGAHALIEDNSVRGVPASIVNLAGYRRDPIRLTARCSTCSMLALQDSRTFYASRVRTEPADGIEDVHVHPVEPRQLRSPSAWILSPPTHRPA